MGTPSIKSIIVTDESDSLENPRQINKLLIAERCLDFNVT